MDSRDQRAAAVSRVVAVLRRATRAAQIAPFVYLLLYAAYLLAGMFASEEVLGAADALFNVAPITTGGMLAVSRLFKLCRWHRIACLLPVSSQVEGCVDTFLVTLTQQEIIVINAAIAAAAVVFLVAAFKHFFRDARRQPAF